MEPFTPPPSFAESSTRSTKKKSSGVSKAKGASSSSHQHQQQLQLPSPFAYWKTRFMLVCKSIRGLQQLYEAADASPQCADIYLVAVTAMKANMTFISSNSNSELNHGGLRCMASLPVDSTTFTAAMQLTSISSSSPPLSAPPLLLLHTTLLHLARFLIHAQHSLPESWVYLNEEVLVDVVERTLNLYASVAATSLSSSSRTAWSLLVLPDVRLLWLRRWLSCFPARQLWNAAGRRKDIGFDSAIEELWRTCKMHVGMIVHGSTEGGGQDSALTSSPHPLLLNLSSADIAAVQATSCFAFLSEHLSNWLPAPRPPSPSPSQSPALASVSNLRTQPAPHRNHGHKGGRGGHRTPSHSHKKTKPAANNSGTKQREKDKEKEKEKEVDAERTAASSATSTLRASFAELCVHLLTCALFLPPSSSTSSHESMASLPVRCRLSLLALAQHFLSNALSHPSDTPVFLQLLTAIEALRTGEMDAIAHVLAAPLSFFAKNGTTNISSSSSSSLHKSRSQVSIHTKQSSTNNSGSGAGAGSSTPQRQVGKKTLATHSSMPLEIPTNKEPSLLPSHLSSESNPAMSMEAATAITAILGLCRCFMQQSTACKAALVQLVIPLPIAGEVHSSSSTPSNMQLFQLLARWLGFEPPPIAGRRFLFVDSLNFPNEDPTILCLPSVVRDSMLQLLQDSVPLCAGIDSSMHLTYLQQMAASMQQLIDALPGELRPTASNSNPRTPPTDDDAPLHQQHPLLTRLLDLWLFYARSALRKSAAGSGHIRNGW